MKTVTGLFDTYSDATAAVTQLESVGVPTEDISIVSNNGSQYKTESNTAVGVEAGAGVGAAVGGAGGLLAGLGLMAIPGIGPVVAAGWLAATAVGAVAGAVAGGVAGGLIGALTKSGVSESDANVYAEGVRRGGSLVTARVDEGLVPTAEAVLKRSNWVDPVQRRAAYSQEGWTNFDESSTPYTLDEIERERGRYHSSGL